MQKGTNMRCINCGRPAAEQRGENLSCRACGHRWTVEDEAANAQYIRAALRREPVISAPKDASPDEATRIEASGQVEIVNLSEMTVAELMVYSDEHGIDLSGVRSARKEDIIARIQETLWERESYPEEPQGGEPEAPEGDASDEIRIDEADESEE
jgi:uncharacterized Zn finger protein (UPF0148 family)